MKCLAYEVMSDPLGNEEMGPQSGEIERLVKTLE